MAMAEAKAAEAVAAKQIEMLVSQLAEAEKKAVDAEREKAVWIDRCLARQDELSARD